MVILITGGAGFIGSHLSENLLQEGHHVICIDNLDEHIYDSSLKQENLTLLSGYSNFHFVYCDIRDKDALTQLLRDYNCDVVVHLAAYAGVRQSVDEPEKFIETNINGTLAVLEAMRKVGVKKLVFASSSSVYGNSPHQVFKETDAADCPISPYAASKRAAELLAYSYYTLYGFEVTCLRLFTVFGPRQRPEMAIRKFIEKIKAGQPIEIYGDGDSFRNYTYISDVVNAFIKAIEQKNAFDIFNIAGQESIKLHQLVALIEKQLNVKALIHYLPFKAGDMPHTSADITKAQDFLNYSPQVTFEVGIKYTIEWLLY